MPVTLVQLRKAIAKGPAAVRALAWPEPRPEPEQARQAALWVIDSEGLPERPWLVCGGSEFRCVTLGCTMRAGVCAYMQAASDAQRTKDTWRGQGFDHPSCVTEKCPQGRAIRNVLDPTRLMRWRGAGPGGRMAGGRRDAPEQYAARVRMQRVGLLDDVPTVDAEPVAVESEEDGDRCEQGQISGKEAPRREEVRAGEVRKPVRTSEGVRRVQEDGAGDGRAAGVRAAGVQYRERRGEGLERRGRDHAGVRVGEAHAGDRGQRAERRARGVRAAPGNSARRDER